MSTEKQIKANRQNAQKSTGPKTDDGKAAVSQNAVKHGLFTGSIITGEDPAEFAAFHDNMLADLAPAGAVETMLAERVVNLWWRLRRAERMQNEAIEDMIEDQVTNPSAIRSRKRHCSYEGLEPGDPRFEPEHLALGRIASTDWSCTRILDRMLLYERRIESSLNRAMRELKRFQVVRRIERQDAGQQLDPSQSLRDEVVTPKKEKIGDLKKQSQYDRSAFGVQRAAITDLKKQSQFAMEDIAASLYAEGGYGDDPADETDENKAKRSQFQAHSGLSGSDRGEVDPAFRASQ
jgi:hypothetical protein